MTGVRGSWEAHAFSMPADAETGPVIGSHGDKAGEGGEEEEGGISKCAVSFRSVPSSLTSLARILAAP